MWVKIGRAQIPLSSLRFDPGDVAVLSANRRGGHGMIIRLRGVRKQIVLSLNGMAPRECWPAGASASGARGTCLHL